MGAPCGVAMVEADGTEALARLLSCFSTRAGVIGFVIAEGCGMKAGDLAKRLAQQSPLPVEEAAAGMAVEENYVYLLTGAPPLSLTRGRFTDEIEAGEAPAASYAERFRRSLELGTPTKAICFVLRRDARPVVVPTGVDRIEVAGLPDAVGPADAMAAELESQRHSREALDNIQLVAVALDLEGRLRNCNSHFLGIVGWKRPEVLGQDWFDRFIPADSRQTARVHFRNVLEGHDKEVQREGEILTRSGQRRMVRWNSTRSHDRAGKVDGAICIGEDITENWRDHQILQAQLRLREFAAAHNLDELLVATLDEASALTESPIGFYHFVGADQRSLSLQAWSTRTTTEFCRAEGRGLHYDIDNAGIWADCVRERRPLIHNDYPAHPRKRGLPVGHAEVLRELVVPVFRNKVVVAILGVGNKPREYNGADLSTVAKLADMAWDIVVAKRAEEALRRSEEKSRQLFQAMAQGVVYQDADGRVEDCNPAAERILGLSLDQMAGRTSTDQGWRALRPDGSDFPGEEHPAMVALRTGTVVSGVTMGVYHPDHDEYRWIVIHAVPKFAPGAASPDQVVTTFEDITERKRAEDALAESEARYRTLVANIPDAVYRCELKAPWRIHFMSEGVQAVTGYTPESFLRRDNPLTWAQLVVAEDLPALESAIAEAVAQKQPFDVEYRIVDAAGNLRWIHETGQAVFDAQGAALCLDGVIGDVTQRKRIEVALAESEQRLRLFVDNAPAAIAMFDRNMRYLFASRRYMADYLLADANIVGRSHYEVFPEIPERWREIHRRCLAGETRSAVEDPFPRADGRLDWVRWEIRPWYLGSGEIGGIILLTENITERKLAEQALRESERRFRETLDNINLIAIGLTVDGRLDYCNDYFLELTGWQRSDALGADWFADFLPPETVPRMRTVLDRAVRENEVPVHFETEIRTRTGRRRVVRWTNTLLRDPAGRVTGAISLGDDVTERRAAQEALRQSEERFRAIANYTSDWESWFDQTGRLVWVSPSVVEFTGYTPEEMLEHPNRFVELLVPEDRASFERELQGALGGTRGTALELRCTRKDGSHFWLSVSWRPIFDQDGNSLGVRTSGRDITYRKDAEAEIRQLNASLELRVAERTAALTTAVKELESFSYSASHDLRTPLRAIEGFGAVLEEEYGAVLDERGRGYLQRIRNGAKRMAQLIDDLLDLARVSRRELGVRRVDLSGLARSAAAKLESKFPASAAQIYVAPGLVARADPVLMRSVLENLLGNALKFSAGNPQPQIEFGSSSADGETVFFVRDNGAGFDMRYVDKLFRPFQRLHNPSEFEGNGIGLATVQRIVQRHGGRAWAEGAIGQGATVYFTLGTRG
jgi:PAS domain S-box-containing protein